MNEFLYYNILSNSTDAFLGTVRVKIEQDPNLPPASRARNIACGVLGGNGAPGGIRAIMSTEEMYNDYKIN